MNFMRQSIRDSKLNQIIQKVFMLTLRTHWMVMYLMKVTGETLDVMKIQLIGMSLITSLKELFLMLMLLKHVLIKDPLHTLQDMDGIESTDHSLNLHLFLIVPNQSRNNTNHK